MTDLTIGATAPGFELAGANGPIRLADLKGRPVVLYFYPKDDTSGCTTEACGFRDGAAAFKKLKAQVKDVEKELDSLVAAATGKRSAPAPAASPSTPTVSQSPPPPSSPAPAGSPKPGPVPSPSPEPTLTRGPRTFVGARWNSGMQAP